MAQLMEQTQVQPSSGTKRTADVDKKRILAMPNVNGWDFLQRLRETGHLGTTPIIVVSAHLRIDPQAVLQMGVAAILPKPFNLPDLINLIEHLSP
jgi:CheY-like chemotaxis protein